MEKDSTDLSSVSNVVCKAYKTVEEMIRSALEKRIYVENVCVFTPGNSEGVLIKRKP